jgi:hypothetical protein
MAVSVTQCEDTIPGSFARVVGNLGTSKTCQTVKPRSSSENFRHIPPQTLHDYNIVTMNSLRI